MNSFFEWMFKNSDPTNYHTLIEIINEELKDYHNLANRGLPPP